MIKFNNYTGFEDLKLDGFQIFKNPPKVIVEILRQFPKDLEHISKTVKPEDVFRTKLGDIKQIQNLNFEKLNAELAKLIDAKEYVILNNQYFCKPPNYKMTSAHQDNAYFESDEDIFTFWIPLQNVDTLNSCMFYVPKSHLEGLVEHKSIGTNVRVRTGKKGVSLYSDYYKNSEYVKVPMVFGEILIHDKNCMHFSSPNLSDNYRIAITTIIKVKKYYKNL